MIRLLCYEPAGQVLTFSADDLTRHVLGLGATGCGKTTGLVNPLLQQVIACHAADGNQKAGLLIIDPKDDETQDKVRVYAREAGRLDDVQILSLTGDSFYDFFCDLKKLDQVDEFTRRVLYGSQEMGDQNAYWTEGRFGLVNSALTVLLATGGRLSFDRVAEFFRSWFFTSNSPEVAEALRFVERLLASENLKETSRRRLQLAIAEAENWKALDQRTRELHKSTLNNALRNLMSPAARDLFDGSKTRRFNPADVLSGKILVASLNSLSHPHLASLLFKSLKRDYCEAVLSRVTVKPESDRLCGLILDELPLSVTPEDVPVLAQLRSKGGFVVACAQGLSGLDEVLGRRRRSALLANFNSVVYFSAREDQTDEHAMLTLGVHEKPTDPDSVKDWGNLQIAEGTPSGHVRLVCPPGSLARLPQHHAYAKLANGTVTKNPVWLEPIFHEYTPAPISSSPDDLAEAIAAIKTHDAEVAKQNADVPLFFVHMHMRRQPLRLTPNLVTAAWQLCRPKACRSRLLAKLTAQILDLESLPPCWLVGISHWLKKNPKLAPTIIGVSVKSGVLWPQLDAAWTLWGDGPLTIPEAINLFIYPSLWRPLLPRHLAQLSVERPDLRQELRSLPQVVQETDSV
jgi:hypothetical protein